MQAQCFHFSSQTVQKNVSVCSCVDSVVCPVPLESIAGMFAALPNLIILVVLSLSYVFI